MASAGIHLAFAGDDRPAGLGRVHDMLPRSGSTTDVQAPAGPGLLHSDRIVMMVPGTAAVKTLTSIQLFLPFPSTSWTLVVSTASAFREMTDPLTTLIRAIGESVRLTPDPVSNADGSARADRATGSTGAAGAERGFGTLVLRRLGHAGTAPVGGDAARAGRADAGPPRVADRGSR